MRVQLLVGFLLLVAFAGCIGSDEVTPEVTDGDQAGDPTPTELTGSIQGQVRKDNLDPIPGARVVLNDGKRLVAETETDEKGMFTINEVEPGFYRIIVTAACCRDFIREIAIRAGQVTDANAMLPFVPTERAYVESDQWTGFISCAVHGWGVGGTNELCDDLDPSTDRIHSFRVQEGIRSVVFAMDWDPELTTMSFLSTTPAMRMRLYYDEDWVGRTYTLLDGGPPLQAIAQPSSGQGEWGFLNLTGEHDLSFQVWASGGWGGFTYQQSFTVYYDVYYWERAPADATALPDL